MFSEIEFPVIKKPMSGSSPFAEWHRDKGHKMNEAIVVTNGERAKIVGSEIIIAVHCQECGEKITDSEAANVAFPRDVQSGEKQSYKIVCLNCDRHRDKKTPTLWIKLHEFIETLADSVGMKAEKKSKK
jgi:hypothetical protein